MEVGSIIKLGRLPGRIVEGIARDWDHQCQSLGVEDNQLSAHQSIREIEAESSSPLLAVDVELGSLGMGSTLSPVCVYIVACLWVWFQFSRSGSVEGYSGSFPCRELVSKQWRGRITCPPRDCGEYWLNYSMIRVRIVYQGICLFRYINKALYMLNLTLSL
jgi:hypothetical protein